MLKMNEKTNGEDIPIPGEDWGFLAECPLSLKLRPSGPYPPCDGLS